MARLHMGGIEHPFTSTTSVKLFINGEGTMVSVSGKDTAMTIPSRPGTYEFQLLVDYADGTYANAPSGKFTVMYPAATLKSATVHRDSMTIEWNDPNPNRTPTTLYLDWSPKYQWIKSDSVVVPALQSWATLPIPDGVRELHVSFGKNLSKRSDQTISLPPVARTFSGSFADTSKLACSASGIGGFKAVARGAIDQILVGEVARLDWWREDSTAFDGAALKINSSAEVFGPPERDWYSDTLSLDLVTPDSMSLQVEVLARCNYFRASQPFDTLRWTLPTAASGHFDLSLEAGGWNLTRMSQMDPYDGPCWVNTVKVIATATRGPRPRQGFLEVDNVRWH